MKLNPEDISKLHPETLALCLGYDPHLSEGSVKPPVFLTSTFQFKTAEEGKRFFELAYGLKEREHGEISGLIYSRINNPNIQIFEERMSAWDQMEKGAVFASGMAAISTTLLSLLRPGDIVLSSAPVYGGTHYLFDKILPRYGIQVHQVKGGDQTPQLMQKKAEELGLSKIKMFYIESPANPSNILVDIKGIVDLARDIEKKTQFKPIVAVDNTFLGPLFQCPAELGADLNLYSATKFIGGHSDLVAGVVTTSEKLMKSIMEYRTILGTMANPFTGWLLLRSLETLSVRMRRQEKSAKKIVQVLKSHKNVKQVFYPGETDSKEQLRLFKNQCKGSGALISFDITGGEKEAFKVLNAFKICRLAVSLGGTESLVEHPRSMTHSDVLPEDLDLYGVTEGMIRISVGIEHYEDLKNDVVQALDSLNLEC